MHAMYMYINVNVSLDYEAHFGSIKNAYTYTTIQYVLSFKYSKKGKTKKESLKCNQ